MGEGKEKITNPAVPGQDEDSLAPGKIRFTYNRSNYYREIISNGAFGGITPDLDIHVSLFSQHHADFVEQIFELTEKGTVGPEISGEQPDIKTIAREIEIGITMNIPAALQLARWLQARVQEAAKIAGFEPPEGNELPEDNPDEKPAVSTEYADQH